MTRSIADALQRMAAMRSKSHMGYQSFGNLVTVKENAVSQSAGTAQTESVTIEEAIKHTRV